MAVDTIRGFLKEHPIWTATLIGGAINGILELLS